MGIPAKVRDQLSMRFEVLMPHLNERQRRLLLATEARLLGHGGVRAVSQVAGVSETTVRAGVFELEEGEEPFPEGRVRRGGGGRKSAAVLDAAWCLPCWRWWSRTSAATRNRRCGGRPSRCGTWPASWPGRGTRCQRLRSAACCGTMASACRATPRRWRGTSIRTGDAQFRYINEQAKDHQAAGEPVISVDTKKREQLGRLPMGGREWRPKGQPVQVEDHSFFFTGPEVEQAIPYGSTTSPATPAG